ncbi:MAG: DsbA family protein [Candidatus Marinimicrobia bacterium]|nr:DsbA family protein [Candidatus Neomarinimicrobiota bacterium]
MREDFEVEIEYKPFFLHPEIPEGGLPAEQLYGGNRGYFDQVKANFTRMAEAVGLPVGDIRVIANTRLALMLGEYAREQGKHEDYHRAVFRAYWAEGSNIGDWDVLQAILTEVGLHLTPADLAAKFQQLSHQVDDQFQAALRQGISGIPTFIIGDRRIVGAQPYEQIRSVVKDVLTGVGDRQ